MKEQMSENVKLKRGAQNAGQVLCAFLALSQLFQRGLFPAPCRLGLARASNNAAHFFPTEYRGEK